MIHTSEQIEPRGGAIEPTWLLQKTIVPVSRAGESTLQKPAQGTPTTDARALGASCATECWGNQGDLEARTAF